MSKTFSGKRVVERLVRIFGFRVVSQRGSHVKLNKQTIEGTVVTIVPLHHELAEGTLRGALRLARVDYEEFVRREE